MGISLMVDDQIAEIGIDPDGQLYVRPKISTFPHIYRAAMKVGWDPLRGVLFSPKPSEWSYRDWFRPIITAVASEYGVRLRVGPGTIWSNIPVELRKQIETDQASASSAG
jgi:hypothetical protein